MTFLSAPLCILAVALAPSSSDADHERAIVACEAVERVVTSHDPIYPGPLGELRTGMLLLAIARHESGFRVDALNREGGDTGICQVRPGKAWGSHTRDQILSSADVGFAVGLNALRISRDACGQGRPTWFWLGVYAAGKCGHASRIARDLCGPAGACSW